MLRDEQVIKYLKLRAKGTSQEIVALQSGMNVKTAHRYERAQQGPEREVIFEQVHVPAERMQTDFLHMQDLHITIVGQPFPHLLHHSVLTYSNVEAVQVCRCRLRSRRHSKRATLL